MPLKTAYLEIRRLLSLLSARKRAYWTGLIVDGLLNASLGIILAFVFGYLVDFTVHRDIGLLYRAVVLTGVVTLALSVLTPLFTYLYHRAVKQTMADVRLKVFQHVNRLPSRYHESRHSGDIQSRMTNDLQAMEQTYTEHTKSILTDLCTLIGSIAAMFLLDWRYACILTGLGLLTLALNAALVRPIRRASDQVQEKAALLTERLSDVLAGIQTVKMFHLHGIVLKRYRVVNDEVARSSVSQGHRSALLEGVNYLLHFMSFGGILVIGIIQFSRGETQLGAMAAIVQLQMSVNTSLQQLGTVVSSLQTSLSGANRVFELLDQPVEPDRIVPTAQPALQKVASDALPTDALLVLKDIVFRYNSSEEAVLNGFNLTLREGQTTALVGASGGGKSTVIKLLLGFYPPDSGLILLGGHPIGELKIAEARARMAYVPQDGSLFSGTIADNIRLGKPDATDEEVVEAAQAAYAHDFIASLPDGYGTAVGERGAMLSGGQRQRIAIARALVKNAPILLLDEATSALDTESEYWVQQALQRLMANRTTLVIAHRLSTVEEADTICVINGGRVVEQGSHEQLLRIGNAYARLHQAHFSLESAGA